MSGPVLDGCSTPEPPEGSAGSRRRGVSSAATMGEGMMASCERMMSGASMHGLKLPQLPPGNEPLQFRMHAEMLQKMGEIAARYAEQIKEAR